MSNRPYTVWGKREYCAWGHHCIHAFQVPFPSEKVYEKAQEWFVETPHQQKRPYAIKAGYKPNRPSRWVENAKLFAMHHWAWEYHYNEKTRIAEQERLFYKTLVESAIEDQHEDHQ